MTPDEFVGSARLLFIAGKGGVGKSTLAATVANLASRAGARVLIVDVDGRRGVAALLGDGIDLPLGQEGRLVRPGSTAGLGHGEIWGRTITPDRALVEYLDDHGLRRFSKRLADSGALEVIASGAPGIRDILVLGKVKQLVMAKEFDLVVLDCPSSGHAVSFLQSPAGLLDAVRGGPVRSQAEGVLSLLTDATLSQAILVTLAEETPVNETVETATALRERVGLRLGPVVMNAILPVSLDSALTPDDMVAAAKLVGVRLRAAEVETLHAAALFRLRRMSVQALQRRRLGDALGLAQIALPALAASPLGVVDVDELTAAFTTELGSLSHVGAVPS